MIFVKTICISLKYGVPSMIKVSFQLIGFAVGKGGGVKGGQYQLYYTIQRIY